MYSYLQTDVELADSWYCSSSPASFSKFMYSYLQTCVALVDSWWRWSIVQELVQVELRWVKGKQQKGPKGEKKEWLNDQPFKEYHRDTISIYFLQKK